MGERTSAERGRFAFSLLLSLSLHAPLLLLTVGRGLGLPGFDFPWRDRGPEPSELRVVLAPAEPVEVAPPPAPAPPAVQPQAPAREVAPHRMAPSEIP